MILFELAAANAISAGLGALILQERLWKNKATKEGFKRQLKRTKKLLMPSVKKYGQAGRDSYRDIVKNDITRAYREVDKRS